MGFWKPVEVAELRSSAENPKVKKLSEIMNKNVKMPFVTVILSFVWWLILTALFITEIVTQYKNEFSLLLFDMKHINALIALVALSVPIFLMFWSCFHLYNNCGNLTVSTYVMYFMAIGILILFDVFWKKRIYCLDYLLLLFLSFYQAVLVF